MSSWKKRRRNINMTRFSWTWLIKQPNRQAFWKNTVVYGQSMYRLVSQFWGNYFALRYSISVENRKSYMIDKGTRLNFCSKSERWSNQRPAKLRLIISWVIDRSKFRGSVNSQDLSLGHWPSKYYRRLPTYSSNLSMIMSTDSCWVRWLQSKLFKIRDTLLGNYFRFQLTVCSSATRTKNY